MQIKQKGKFTDWSELLKEASITGPEDLRPYITALWNNKNTPIGTKNNLEFLQKN